MKKKLIDLAVLALIAIHLLLIMSYDLFEEYTGFIFIPFMVVYYIGQYVERKFASKAK